MTFKKHVPNILTLLNLLSGTIAVFFAVKEQLVVAALFVFLGIFFDFFDGFAARLLKVQGELGKQLDSLADVVTSGVVPGIVMFQLILASVSNTEWTIKGQSISDLPLKEYLSIVYLTAIIGLLITLAAAYRLAKFNIDERQTSSFIGLPTPAAALVVLSLPLIQLYTNNELALYLIESTWFLVLLTLVLCYFMNAEIPLFSLKFKDYSWRNNVIKYIFVLSTLLLVVLFQYIAIPLVIVLYVLLSLITRKKSINE
ncbi:CDP-diacylglycerol---serine O-phosphatidyltransferase [Lutibacter agarilyticus]|uniref:CDP-diacylglycerol---serine O-phosphatidyltransferase n=1 Tax=Lutibacter agarilyticus TaxID=1109740 RepID=A0A238VB75_9FLAO|nr:CDP-alcohol phosphatidyltransferase family protein [Lutibacter agarilyticus]SNR31660.1 CDP-diacylglycerol---serine O-phosphatidyltransferase [Lutibacter agarilyticus]